MDRSDVINRLKSIEHDIRTTGVGALYLYGSHARDTARAESDIDILVEFRHGQGQDLAEYMAPYRVLEEAFPGIVIGYSTREGIVPRYQPFIETTAIRIF
jgi:predicted nucleotidyltransferase